MSGLPLVVTVILVIAKKIPDDPDKFAMYKFLECLMAELEHGSVSVWQATVA